MPSNDVTRAMDHIAIHRAVQHVRATCSFTNADSHPMVSRHSDLWSSLLRSRGIASPPGTNLPAHPAHSPTGRFLPRLTRGKCSQSIIPWTLHFFPGHHQETRGALTKDEIEFFVRGATDGAFADYQTSALLMAIVWRGMTPQETAWLTDAMMRSGDVIDLGDVEGIKVDKHSTGGVGDKVSLILAPLAAVCGIKVPMMSGRGLGHTGGTVDKLEGIPGFKVQLTVPEFRDILRKVGVAMISQTPQVVPADRKLYALRDVTGTVESIPLICASIMSKKLAEGIGRTRAGCHPARVRL